MLGRRALTTAALTSAVIVQVTCTLSGEVLAGATVGQSRSIAVTLGGQFESGAVTGINRPVALQLTSGANAGAAVGLIRSISADLTSGADAGAEAGSGFTATLAGWAEAGASVGVIRHLTADLAGGADAGASVGAARLVTAGLMSWADAGAVSGAGSEVAATLSGQVAAGAAAGVARTITASLTAWADAGALAGRYNPSLARAFGPVVGEWQAAMVVAEITTGESMAFDDTHRIILGSAAPLPVTLRDQRTADRSPLNLTGCAGFVAKAVPVDGGAPVLFAGVSVVDAVAGKLQLQHTAEAFSTPGIYRLRVEFQDGAANPHIYPNARDTRLEVVE